MPSPLRPSFVLLAAVPLIAACAKRVPVAGAEAEGADSTATAAGPRREIFTVVVVNGYSGLVDVFAVGGGITDRLGTVSLGTPQSFRVPLNQFPPGQPIQLVATPLAGRGRATSGPVTVRAGDTIEFTIGPTLGGSVIVR